MHRFLLVPPEIGVYREMQDGRMLWQADGSRNAVGYIEQAVQDVMEAHALRVESITPDNPGTKEMQDIRNLYRNVNRSIQLHIYGPQVFAAKQQVFDYSLGSIRQVLNKSGTDALVLVMGNQTVYKLGPEAWLSIAIVAPDGRIAWYGMQAGRESVSLETSDKASELVRRTLRTFLEELS